MCVGEVAEACQGCGQGVTAPSVGRFDISGGSWVTVVAFDAVVRSAVEFGSVVECGATVMAVVCGL